MRECILLLTSAVMATAAAAPDPGSARWIEDLGGRVTRSPQGKVTGVDLRGTWVEDTDLRQFSQFPDLERLDLSLTHITDQGMQELRALKNVADLNLYYAEYVTDEGLSAIKDWKKLKRLNVHGAKISDNGLEHLSGITTLESLDVGSTMMTDVGLERLTTLPNLRHLTMGGNELGDAGLQALRQLPALTYLDLAGRTGNDKNVWTISMSETGLAAVLTLKELRELRFGCTSVAVGIEGAKFAEVSALNLNRKWLEQIRTLPKLEKLTLQGCKRVDDNAIAVLAQMPALRQLDLKGTSVTDAGAEKLRAERPNLVVYSGPWEAKAAAYRNN